MDLVTDRQFSYLFLDKSLVQVFYEFDRGELRKARLAYYPFPIPTTSDQWEDYDTGLTDNLLSEMILALMEEGDLVTNSSHFRIDYDATARTHSVSHCQFSGINDLRLPLNVIFTPFLFVDFIIRNVFPSVHRTQLVESINYRPALSHARRSVETLDDSRENNLYITVSTGDRT